MGGVSASVSPATILSARCGPMSIASRQVYRILAGSPDCSPDNACAGVNRQSCWQSGGGKCYRSIACGGDDVEERVSRVDTVNFGSVDNRFGRRRRSEDTPLRSESSRSAAAPEKTNQHSTNAELSLYTFGGPADHTKNKLRLGLGPFEDCRPGRHLGLFKLPGAAEYECCNTIYTSGKMMEKENKRKRLTTAEGTKYSHT